MLGLNAADANILEKLIRKAGSVLGSELESLVEVSWCCRSIYSVLDWKRFLSMDCEEKQNINHTCALKLYRCPAIHLLMLFDATYLLMLWMLFQFLKPSFEDSLWRGGGGGYWLLRSGFLELMIHRRGEMSANIPWPGWLRSSSGFLLFQELKHVS